MIYRLPVDTRTPIVTYPECSQFAGSPDHDLITSAVMSVTNYYRIKYSIVKETTDYTTEIKILNFKFDNNV